MGHHLLFFKKIWNFQGWLIIFKLLYMLFRCVLQLSFFFFLLSRCFCTDYIYMVLTFNYSDIYVLFWFAFKQFWEYQLMIDFSLWSFQLITGSPWLYNNSSSLYDVSGLAFCAIVCAVIIFINLSRNGFRQNCMWHNLHVFTEILS